MTLKEAVARYLSAARAQSNPYLSADEREFAHQEERKAYEEIQRIRHHEVTEHESVCHRTPTVHAYGAVAA